MVDRRVHYWIIPGQGLDDEEPLGFIHYVPPVGSGRRMICECPAGKQAYEDRLDGDDRGKPCAHERRLLDWLQSHVLDGERAGRQGPAPAVNVGMYE